MAKFALRKEQVNSFPGVYVIRKINLVTFKYIPKPHSPMERFQPWEPLRRMGDIQDMLMKLERSALVLLVGTTTSE